jgi:hypothetical protein
MPLSKTLRSEGQGSDLARLPSESKFSLNFEPRVFRNSRKMGCGSGSRCVNPATGFRVVPQALRRGPTPDLSLLEFRRGSLGIDANGSNTRHKFKKPGSSFGPLPGLVSVLTALSPAAAFFFSVFDSSFAVSRAFWASATLFRVQALDLGSTVSGIGFRASGSQVSGFEVQVEGQG